MNHQIKRLLQVDAYITASELGHEHRRSSSVYLNHQKALVQHWIMSQMTDGGFLAHNPSTEQQQTGIQLTSCHYIQSLSWYTSIWKWELE